MIRIDLSSHNDKIPASIIEVASDKSVDEREADDSLIKIKEDELKAAQ